MMAVGSFVAEHRGASPVLWFLYLGIFAGGLRAVWSERRLAVAAGILAVVFLGSLATDPDLESRVWTLVASLAGLIFFCLLITALARDIATRQTVDRDTIFGAACVYLLLGMAWAMVYLILETSAPGSFVLPPSPGGADHARDLMYFSYVTLATVGYGDVAAVSHPARAFAALEGIFGQLYVAVAIARLVSLQTRGQGAGSRRP